MASTLDRLAFEAGQLLKFIGALASAEGGPAATLRSVGWDLPPGGKDLGLAAIDVSTLVQKVENLERSLDNNASDALLAAQFAEVLLEVEQAIVNIRGAIAGLGDVDGYLEKTQIKNEILGRLTSVMVAARVGAVSPLGFMLLQFFGVIKLSHFDADPTIFQVDHIRVIFDWSALGKLFTDPLGLIEARYGWGTASFDARGFIANLNAIIEVLGEPSRARKLPRRVEEQLSGKSVPEADTSPLTQAIGVFVTGDASDGVEAGISLFPLRPTTPGGIDGGIAVCPFVYGSADLSFPLTDELTLEFQSTVALDSGVALQFRPGQNMSVKAGLLTDSIEDHITGTALVSLTWAAPDSGRYTLVSFPGGGGIAVGSISFAGGVDVLQGSLSPSFGVKLTGGHASIASSGSDSFIGSLLPANGVDLKFDLGMRWSGAHGFRFEGSASGEVDLAAHLSVGGLRIDALHLGVTPSDSGIALEVSCAAGATLGPLSVALDRIGTQAVVALHDGNLGPIDVSLAFKPPSGIGLAIEAQGVVSGGGFLFHDPVQQTYAGVLQLSLYEQITLTAFGLIATRLPDGSRGYSLVVFITAEDFRPIQLGMGFTLLGIGGMVAINRTFDQDALRQGLKDDTLGTLLFPRDAVANAPAIIRALGTVFPAHSGSYLLGVLAKIGWFTPTLVLLELALILEFGARRRLLVLGRISALLPSPDNDLIRLNLDAIGVIDFDQGTAAIDAVLVDSRLVHAYALTGAMALRAKWGAGPGSTFVLAVGGLNPRFPPPADLPKLDRIAIALCSGNNPRLTCEAYFAITANTVQFGARASLYAAAYGFSVEGDIGYDVLLQIVPLHFVADFHAKVQLKRGSSNLFSVSLEGELEGPRPLRVSGKASFEIFWCDFSVRFDKTLVDGEKPPLPPAVDLLGDLTRALASATSWSVRSRSTHGVALRRLAPGATLVLDPLGTLVVQQQVAPLNTARDIDTYGGAPVAGARRFQLAATLQNQAQSVAAVRGQFAPAQYFTMSDDEKLAAPSFEEMDAGIAIGSPGMSFDEVVPAPLQYEAIVIDTLPQPATQDKRYILPVGLLMAQTKSGAVARAPLRRAGQARFRQADAPPAVTLSALRWTIMPLAQGAAASVDPKVRTWSEYRAALDALNRGAANWQMVPTHELAA